MMTKLESLEIIPKYIAFSSWWQHVPIAHWIIENIKPNIVVELGTHYGVSFFAFTEAAQALSPETFIYAVDTWEGDEHAGYYDESIYEDVHSYWQSNHKQHSSLLRMRFDEAASHFSEKSIDVLHIDGLHTYEAVKNDHQTWKTRLSENSIVIFHDINVKDYGFGVWKYWEELKRENKTIEVLNGHGLGILINGEAMEHKLCEFPEIASILKAKGNILEEWANVKLNMHSHTNTDLAIRELSKSMECIEVNLGNIRAVTDQILGTRDEILLAKDEILLAKDEIKNRLRMRIGSRVFIGIKDLAKKLVSFLRDKKRS